MVVTLDPTNAEAWFDYGDTQQELGNAEEAIRALTECIRLAPQFAPAFYSKAKSFLEKGQKKEALENLAKAFSIDHELKKSFVLEFPALSKAREFTRLLKR
jgi:tetratricopeptide (TPR) repeat protein